MIRPRITGDPQGKECFLMHIEGDEIHVSSEEASGGTQPKVLRYMLAVSLFLAIVTLSAIWMTGSFLS
jgi:hypothetical protein